MSVIIQKLVAVLIIWLHFTQLAGAGTIVVSGDVNIANFIDGSYDFPITQGNGSFLRNVLGNGTTVFVRKEGTDPIIFGVHEAQVINDLYNSIGGVTSILDSSGDAIISGRLVGFDLFIDVLPSNSYSLAELAEVTNFLADSGTLLFLGENVGAYETNAVINQALSALGSSLQLGSDLIIGTSSRPWILSPNIVNDPLTFGISSFGYGYTNTVSGGRPLLQTIDSQTFIAYDSIGATVPEPTTFSLCGAALLIVSFGTTRRRHRHDRIRHWFRWLV